MFDDTSVYFFSIPIKNTSILGGKERKTNILISFSNLSGGTGEILKNICQIKNCVRKKYCVRLFSAVVLIGGTSVRKIKYFWCHCSQLWHWCPARLLGDTKSRYMPHSRCKICICWRSWIFFQFFFEEMMKREKFLWLVVGERTGKKI